VKSIPRILPLVGIAIGGVIAVNAIAGARDLPNLIDGAKAWAEEAAKPAKATKGKGKAGKDAAADASATNTTAATGDASNTAATGIPGLPPPSIKPQPVCAPTAAELAKEAGLSPAELQVLQNLGARRGELDARESDLSTQLALVAAAEEKLDAKAKALEGLKADVQNLLNQADGREQAEVDRLVTVFSGMKPKDAAPRMVLLDDSIRLPIAAKMKPRALSAILAQMAPTDAKKITEGLAKRFSAAQTLAQNGLNAANAATPAAAAPAQPGQAAAATAAPAKKAAPVKTARKSPRKHAPASKQAAAKAPADAAAPDAAATPAAAAPKAG
jgi:flagellar motility protein MotE (MotC chaperone)